MQRSTTPGRQPVAKSETEACQRVAQLRRTAPTALARTTGHREWWRGRTAGIDAHAIEAEVQQARGHAADGEAADSERVDLAGDEALGHVLEDSLRCA